MSEQLEKRTWCYAGKPISYGIPGCKCGNEDCEYSEYKDRLWCAKCQIDFEPEHWGVFVGPICFHASRMLGMNFDRLDLVNNTYVAFDDFGEKGDQSWSTKLTEKVLTTPEEIKARLEYLDGIHQDFLEKSGTEVVGDRIRFKS